MSAEVEADEPTTDDTEEPTYWTVSKVGDSVSVELGPGMAEIPISDTSKVHLLGETLIKIGTHMMGSAVEGDEEEEEWE